MGVHSRIEDRLKFGRIYFDVLMKRPSWWSVSGLLHLTSSIVCGSIADSQNYAVHMEFENAGLGPSWVTFIFVWSGLVLKDESIVLRVKFIVSRFTHTDSIIHT